jgi:hypothetical protein
MPFDSPLIDFCCSDPDAANKLAPYCAFKQTCTITADRNLFTESTCDPSITEYFQARWWCRPGMFLEQKSIKGLSNYKKDALDSQPQVIKSTNSLPMVGGSLRVLRLLPPLKLVAMI